MANKTGAWGIESIKFAPLVDKPNAAGGTYNSETLTAKSAFPKVWEEFKLKAIVKDSLSFNDQAPSTNNVEIEDSDNYYAVLQSDAGSEGFTVQVYDMSKEAYMFFFGFKEGEAKGDDEGYLVEDPKFKLQNHAVQIQTKGTDEFPSHIFEWANMKLVVTKSGSIGKSGFPNINIECTKQAVFDVITGDEMPSARHKPNAGTTDSNSGHDHAATESKKG